ncbi:hypothetical protein CHUAL_001253 [Chamberlinius hualienensis]
MTKTDLIILTKCCRPLLILLHVGGLKLEFENSRDNLTWSIRLWRIIIIFSVLYSLAQQMFTIINDFGFDGLWVLAYCDFFSVFGFIYIICLRGDDIIKFTVQTMNLSVSNRPDDRTFRQIRTKTWILTIFCVFTMAISAVYIYIHAVTVYQCENFFKFYYFRISASPTGRSVYSGMSELIYCFICFLSQMYGSFAVLVIHVVGIGYENVNQSFSQLKIVTMENVNKFQEQHHALNEICNKFNQLFSPAILFLLCVLILQIMGITGNAITQISTLKHQYSNKYPYLIYIFWLNILIPAIRSLYIMLSLLRASHKVHQQHCSRTILYSTKWLSLPTTINASGLFTLDYGLFGMVVSVSLTYWALVGQIKDDVEETELRNVIC